MKHLVLLFSLVLVVGIGAGLPGVVTDHTPAPADINWYSLEEAQKQAKSSDKKVIIYMEAQWCGYCKKMEREVFPQKEVQQVLHKYYYPVRLDIESDNLIRFRGKEMTEQQFANSIRVTGTPTYLFLDGQGQILGKQPGFIPADTFKALLAFVGTDAYGEMKFEEYLKNEFNK